MKFVHTADTHLGFEVLRSAWPDKEGRERRARFVADNFRAVIDHARAVNADVLLHGGDLFNKHYLNDRQALEAVQPLIELAREGMPVVLVPGNHERSVFPFDLFHGVPNCHIFSEPQSIVLTLDGWRVGVAGFPYLRNDSRRLFAHALAETGYHKQQVDFTILLVHQAFDSAVVGLHNFAFSDRRPDTVNRGLLPGDIKYIAAGHIHRFQILLHPLYPGVQIAYPGAIQRMSFAEAKEDKGFIEGELVGESFVTTFRPLPSYEMERIVIQAGHRTAAEVGEEILDHAWRVHRDLVLRFHLTGGSGLRDYPRLDYAYLRQALAPVLECQFMLDCKRKQVLR